MCLHVQVITREDDKGHKLEPYEEAVVEVPESHMGGVVDLMGSRKGQMLDMAASTEGLNRVTYRIPTRGLLGLRNAILTATKVRPCGCITSTYLKRLRHVLCRFMTSVAGSISDMPSGTAMPACPVWGRDMT